MKTNFDTTNPISFQALTIRNGIHRWGNVYAFNKYSVNSATEKLKEIAKGVDIQVRLKNYTDLGFDVFAGKERKTAISRMFAFLFGHKEKIRCSDINYADDVGDLIAETAQKAKDKYLSKNN